MINIYKPVKNFKTSHFGSNFWDCFSFKLDRDAYFYSDLEYEHWILVETNPLINNFCEQPIKIELEYEGKMHSTIFDMWIQWNNGKEEFIEIKYSKDIKESLNPNCKRSMKTHIQLAIQKEWCSLNGYLYRIVTEEDIRSQPMLSNKKLIMPYIRDSNSVSDIDKKTIMNKLTEKETLVSSLALDTNLDQQTLNKTLFSLYIQQKININLDEILYSNNSKVRLHNDR
ncbi:Tn7 transposase TnsA N-terminal domain-containing protein [Psychrobacillus sp. PGGUH221]